jgi:hypothetical protein
MLMSVCRWLGVGVSCVCIGIAWSAAADAATLTVEKQGCERHGCSGTGSRDVRSEAARSSCGALHGKDRASGKRLKLVWQGKARTRLVGCVPGGPVRTLLRMDIEATRQQTKGRILQVAGEVVLFFYSRFDQYDSSRQWTVFDVGTGASYEVAFSGLGGPGCSCAQRALTARINALGQAVALIDDDDSGYGGGSPLSVAAFTPAGVRHDLDQGAPGEISPTSLLIAGSSATWRHGDMRKSVVLPLDAAQ